MIIAILIIAVVAVLLVVLSGYKAIRIIPQARARNVERFGRYTRTLETGDELDRALGGPGEAG